MCKKIVGIFIVMLLIISSLSVTGNFNNGSDIIETDLNKDTIWKISSTNEIEYKNLEKSKSLSYNIESINVEIVKPNNGVYLFDNRILPFIKPLILGPITIQAEVTGGDASRVEFFIDDELKMVDYDEPFEWKWDETSFKSHMIKVEVYGEALCSISENSDQLEVSYFNIHVSPPEELSKEEAIDLLINEVIKPSSLNHTVYAFTLDNPLSEGDKTAPWLPDPLPASIEKFPFLIYRETQTTEWFFWIDDAPRAYFVHENRFVYINAFTHLIEIKEEQWWPVLNDEDLWSTPEELWNSDNWAYTNDIYPPPSFSEKNFRYTEYALNRNKGDSSLGSEGAIVINGGGSSWFGENENGMGLFWRTYPGFTTTTVSPPDNNQSNIEDAFNSTDCDDVVVYICGHGGTDDSGEPYISCGGDEVTEDELCEMANEHPNTEYKWVIQSCHSGNFMESLKKLNNTAKIITSCKGNEKSWSDWDPEWDPNKDDKGSEFTSGFVEDLWEEWLKNPLIDIVDLLDKAFQSAVAKDASADERAIDRGFHETPQCWERPETDTTAPVNNIISPKDGDKVTNPIIITGYATDVGSGISELDYLLEWDGGSYDGGSTYIDPPLNYLNYYLGPIDLAFFIDPGDWIRITIYAIDAAENIGSDSIKVTWLEESEDTIPPVTEKTVLEPNEEGGYIIWPFTPILLEATDEGGSGVNHIYYEIAWDIDEDGIWDELFQETIYNNYVEIQTLMYGIELGIIELRWYAVDNANNVEEMHHQQHLLATW